AAAEREPDHSERALIKLGSPIDRGFHLLLQLIDVFTELVTLLINVALYLIWCFAHWTFSFIVRVVFSGTTFTPLSRFLPTLIRIAATTATTKLTINAASHASTTMDRACTAASRRKPSAYNPKSSPITRGTPERATFEGSSCTSALARRTSDLTISWMSAMMTCRSSAIE